MTTDNNNNNNEDKLDEIFNKTRKNMIPEDIWQSLEKFPATKLYYENHYFIEKVERKHPRELGIIKDALEEAHKIGQSYSEKYHLLIDFLKKIEFPLYTYGSEIDELEKKMKAVDEKYDSINNKKQR